MECGRNYAESRFRWSRRTRCGKVGMALQANESDLLPREHPWIRRSVRFVTTRTALEPYRSVFKCERPSLIAVAAETARFVGRKRLHHARTEAPMGVVAIDARHGAFRNPMLERLLKLTPGAPMATRALFIDGCRLSRHQACRSTCMNRMTRCAGDLALGMTALNASGVRRPIQMAFQASLIHVGGRKLGRIPDLIRRSGLGMLTPRAMTGFAGLAVPSSLLIRLNDLMRALPDRVEYIFVAGLADLRADVGRRLIAGGRLLRADLPPQQSHAQNRPSSIPVSEHALCSRRTRRSPHGTPRSFHQAASYWPARATPWRRSHDSQCRRR